MGIEALFHKTARLPLVEFRPPKDVVEQHGGQHAVGLYYGGGAIDGILERIVAKMGAETRVIATEARRS